MVGVGIEGRQTICKGNSSNSSSKAAKKTSDLFVGGSGGGDGGFFFFFFLVGGGFCFVLFFLFCFVLFCRSGFFKGKYGNGVKSMLENVGQF